MKPSSNVVALGMLSAALAGCVDLNIASRRSPNSPVVVWAPPVLDTADAATIAEIDAAARLSFDSAQLPSLKQIAERDRLSPAVQVHLVNVGYRCLNFEKSKVALLRVMIANRSFCDATRHAIVTQLGSLSFDSNKQAILREINQRLSAVQ